MLVKLNPTNILIDPTIATALFNVWRFRKPKFPDGINKGAEMGRFLLTQSGLQQVKSFQYFGSVLAAKYQYDQLAHDLLFILC